MKEGTGRLIVTDRSLLFYFISNVDAHHVTSITINVMTPMEIQGELVSALATLLLKYNSNDSID